MYKLHFDNFLINEHDDDDDDNPYGKRACFYGVSRAHTTSGGSNARQFWGFPSIYAELSNLT